MNEDQIRELLKEMREEPVPPDSLARVRLGVAEGIQRGSWWRTWALAASVVAVCAVVALVILLKPVQRIEIPAPPVVAVRPETPVRAPQRTVRPVVNRPHRVARPAQVRDGIVIRIETEDPNVVILLVGE